MKSVSVSKSWHSPVHRHIVKRGVAVFGSWQSMAQKCLVVICPSPEKSSTCLIYTSP